jgi:hypothetical protein
MRIRRPLRPSERIEEILDELEWDHCRLAPDVSEHDWANWLSGFEPPLVLGFCPECGGKLVERTGKYGDFVGCDNYPECKYTESLREREDVFIQG